MSDSRSETLTLNAVLITEALLQRPSRTPNLQAENQAMQVLIHQMAQDSQNLMQTLVDKALELCEADTTGVSLLESTPHGEDIFRWSVLAGTLAHHVGGSTPRSFSPCGVCLDQGSAVLFSHPERYFTYLQDVKTPIVEGLVLPLIADHHAFGTIWIMSHEEGRQFDSEDVRVVTSLADFTATALLLQQRQMRELLAANAALEAEMVERQQVKDQTHALIANLPGGAVFMVDRNLRYLMAEGEALAIAGFKPKDFIGHTLFEVLPPDLAASYEPMYRQALAGEPFEHEHNTHNHTYISRGTPLRAENGEIYAVLVVSYDISDRKQAEANRIQLIQEQSACAQERQRAESLAELDRAKTSFFSNVSHEFRTPLTLMLALLQEVLSDDLRSGEAQRTHPLDPIYRERLELVHHNSLRLLKLVNTLLDFSRIEAGRMEAVYEPTDLATYTAELASVFRSALERAGLQLMVDCPPLPEPVFVDREMWEKIVLNLLSNAFKFTFEGEIRVSLGSPDGNQAILEICDTGTGIDPEHLPHLFERFYQVRGTQARTHDGSGIGLALVHELVHLHGGTIGVNSMVGKGTCFAIALPFGTDHLPSVRVASSKENCLQSEGDATMSPLRDRHPVRTLASTAMGATAYVEEAERWLPTIDLPQLPLERGEKPVKVPFIKGDLGGFSKVEADPLSCALVLLVDDNADMREYLTRILSDYVQVEAVADGVTALAVAQARVPDLILSDVMMPGLDGFELLEALRADPCTREIPIILLSARAGEEAIVEGLEAGADDYLIKPFSAQELVSRVNAHLQIAHLRREALQDARHTIRNQDELLSTVSHELNTPLVSILGWTRLLRSNPPSPAMLTKALASIERNATLQARLVQDLLDISRITAGKLQWHPQPVALETIIETAIATFDQTAAEQGITLVWQRTTADLERDAAIVWGDADRLQQVMANLLSNAIKFTPAPGSIRITLMVINPDSAAEAPYAEIRVTDTGIGIAAEFLPHIFDRFRQAGGLNSSKGLGLGLTIAHYLVKLHHGIIQAESPGIGLGSTLTVKLPLWTAGEFET